jgi:two-component sensor histidine kinase
MRCPGLDAAGKSIFLKCGGVFYFGFTAAWEHRAMRLVDPETISQGETLRQLVLAVERLAGSRSTDDVVATLRATARNMVGADGICIVLRDRGKCFYVEEDAIAPLWKGGRFPMETCISGWAMLNDRTAVIPDVFIDERIPHAIYRDTFVKAMVMTPIGRGEPLAALGAYWARNITPSREIVDTLETLARAAATALDNAYLYGALSASLKKTEVARDDLRIRLGNAFAAIEHFAATTLQPLDARELSLRLSALRRAHALASDTYAIDGVVQLGDLVAAEIEPYRPQSGAWIDCSGPDLPVSGGQAITVALILNDLALQASRGGSLNTSDAGLSIRWFEEGTLVRLEWKQVFPSAAEANAAGNLGSSLVRSLVSAQLGGFMRRVINGATMTLMIEFPSTRDVVFPANADVA